MSSFEARRLSSSRIVFLSRDPVLHQRSGSTTYILGLLKLLAAQGATVTLVATTAFSRSPRLFFRVLGERPASIDLRYPGYLRLGRWYILPFRLKAWARLLARVAIRRPGLRFLHRAIERLYGGGLYTGSWDLTVPTPGECEIALREGSHAQATAVIANYCFWGPLLADGRLGPRRTAILMHDLLSARVRRFDESATPLDMPRITAAEEMRWLSAADTVFAAQEREAEEVRPQVTARVVVTPVLLEPRALPADAVVDGRCFFVGSDIEPNRTALAFLLQAVWPRVRAEVPGATLAVAGSVCRALTADGLATHPSTSGIAALGLLPSLETEYARAAVCLVPLQMGTGIKIKLLEALGFGKAIVSTSVGIQGLEDWAPRCVEVADEAEAFADSIVRLLTDEPFRRTREEAALLAANTHFGPERALDRAFLEAFL